jgi:hypothetical protein
VISALLAREPPWRSSLFELWSLFEKWRAYSNYVRLAREAGETPHRIANDDAFERAALAARDDVRDHLDVRADGTYGWVASSERSRPTFADLERQAGLSRSRTWYVLANRSVHASAMPAGSLPDAFDLQVSSEEHQGVLLGSLGFAARCMVDVMWAVSGLAWHSTPTEANNTQPFVMAAEGTWRAVGYA